MAERRATSGWVILNRSCARACVCVCVCVCVLMLTYDYDRTSVDCGCYNVDHSGESACAASCLNCVCLKDEPDATGR